MLCRPAAASFAVAIAAWWTNAQITPVALAMREGQPNGTAPAALLALSGAEGEVDNAFFPALGPVPSRCPGRERSGTTFNNAAAAACPAAFPYRSSKVAEICYNTSSFAKAGGGPCGSWCTTDVNMGSGCGDNHAHLCKTTAPSTRGASVLRLSPWRRLQSRWTRPPFHLKASCRRESRVL